MGRGCSALRVPPNCYFAGKHVALGDHASSLIARTCLSPERSGKLIPEAHAARALSHELTTRELQLGVDHVALGRKLVSPLPLRVEHLQATSQLGMRPACLCVCVGLRRHLCLQCAGSRLPANDLTVQQPPFSLQALGSARQARTICNERLRLLQLLLRFVAQQHDLALLRPHLVTRLAFGQLALLKGCQTGIPQSTVVVLQCLDPLTQGANLRCKSCLGILQFQVLRFERNDLLAESEGILKESLFGDPSMLWIGMSVGLVCKSQVGSVRESWTTQSWRAHVWM
mmetsp:Transcript_14771/g.40804  ORF Transcript_14771/g.40804 Transcript_14771/m.40804 type:complete len:285 (-) Transcript_14771:78-932(-)